MAQIVGAFGVPHTPIFPFFVQRDGPDCEIARFFAALTEHLEALRPDLIVMFDTDHLNTFFLDNLPIFAVGFVVAFVSAWIAVAGFLRLLQRGTLRPFAWYRLAVAPIIFYFMRSA